MADASVPDIGLTLHNARTQRRLSIEQVAQDTRISARFLEALEAERFDSLPAPVYVRGFLRSYASYLRLDPTPLLAQLPESGVAIPQGTATRVAPASPRAQDAAFQPEAPRARAGAQRSDPFRRSATATPATIPNSYDAPGDSEEERWEDDGGGDAAPFEPELPRFQGRRTQGVLAEGDDDGNNRGGGRTLLMAAGGVLVLLVTLATAVFLTQGDDDAPSAASASGSPTAVRRTVVALGSATVAPTAGNGAPTTAADAGATAAPSATVEGTSTPEPALPTPRPAPTTAPSNQQPAATPTPTEQPTPTPEQPTPTPTRVVATPTPVPLPTPIIAHPFATSECLNGNCGDPPFRVVCVPDGSWFLDVGSNWGPLPNGWREMVVQRIPVSSPC